MTTTNPFTWLHKNDALERKAARYYLGHPFRSQQATSNPLHDIYMDVLVQGTSALMFVGIASSVSSMVELLPLVVSCSVLVWLPTLITATLKLSRVQSLLTGRHGVTLGLIALFGIPCLWLSRFPHPVKQFLSPDDFHRLVDGLLYVIDPAEDRSLGGDRP